MITDRAKLGIAKYTRINDLRLLKWTFKGVKENSEKNRNFVLMLEVRFELFLRFDFVVQEDFII